MQPNVEQLPEQLVQVAESLAEDFRQGRYSEASDKATIAGLIANAIATTASTRAYLGIKAEFLGGDVIDEVEQVLREYGVDDASS